MLHVSKLLLAAVVLVGFAALPTVSQAESSKAESVSSAKKGKGGVDEFEENRKAHMQKSKENNEKKGAE